MLFEIASKKPPHKHKETKVIVKHILNWKINTTLISYFKARILK